MVHATRRQLITLLGGAAVWPLAARAQQPPKAVIGFLDPRSPEAMAGRLTAFRQGLKETGYVEGENLTIEYRWGEGNNERLPALAADLVRQGVAVIATVGPPAAFAVKATTTTIPQLFIVAEDPVRLGLVASLARPGGNRTGFNLLNSEVVTKRLELLGALVPGARRIAVLVNPADASNTEPTLRDLEATARAMTLQIQVLNADSNREIDAAFEAMARDRPDALFVAATPYLTGRRVQLAQLATLHRLPATYSQRDFVEVGGLMSYGTNVMDAFRQIGVYAGRILKGAKPAELPVVQASKLELVINIQTARMLGLTVPDKLLSIADQVIE